MAEKVKKTCDHPGCDKRRKVGAFCKDHQGDADAAEKVVKLTEIEALRWAKLDTEMRNTLQGMKIAELELERQERLFVERKSALQLQHQKLKGDVDRMRTAYEEFVISLAKKYNIPDPKQMSIDPDTGVIRDLREMRE